MQARGVVDGCQLWWCSCRARPRRCGGRCSPEEPCQPFIHSCSLCAARHNSRYHQIYPPLLNWCKINFTLITAAAANSLRLGKGKDPERKHFPLSCIKAKLTWANLPAVLFSGDFSVKYSLSKAGMYAAFSTLKYHIWRLCGNEGSCRSWNSPFKFEKLIFYLNRIYKQLLYAIFLWCSILYIFPITKHVPHLIMKSQNKIRSPEVKTDIFSI